MHITPPIITYISPVTIVIILISIIRMYMVLATSNMDVIRRATVMRITRVMTIDSS